MNPMQTPPPAPGAPQPPAGTPPPPMGVPSTDFQVPGAVAPGVPAPALPPQIDSPTSGYMAAPVGQANSMQPAAAPDPFADPGPNTAGMASAPLPGAPPAPLPEPVAPMMPEAPVMPGAQPANDVMSALGTDPVNGVPINDIKPPSFAIPEPAAPAAAMPDFAAPTAPAMPAPMAPQTPDLNPMPPMQQMAPPPMQDFGMGQPPSNGQTIPGDPNAQMMGAPAPIGQYDQNMDPNMQIGGMQQQGAVAPQSGLMDKILGPIKGIFLKKK